VSRNECYGRLNGDEVVQIWRHGGDEDFVSK